MVSERYVMRRANGDLLAVEIDHELRIPIWSSREEAARYKALNPELIFFWPVKLDKTMMSRVESGLGKEDTTSFFLLSEDAPDAELSDGKPVNLDDIFPQASGTTQSASGAA